MDLIATIIATIDDNLSASFSILIAPMLLGNISGALLTLTGSDFLFKTINHCFKKRYNNIPLHLFGPLRQFRKMCGLLCLSVVIIFLFGAGFAIISALFSDINFLFYAFFCFGFAMLWIFLIIGSALLLCALDG